MGDINNKNGKVDMEAQIDQAMNKIMQDTIGHMLGEETVDTPEEKEKKSVVGKVIAILIVLALLCGAGIYGYYAYQYSDKFFPNTTVNNIDCSGLTAAQAEALIKSKVEDYQIELEFREVGSRIIEGSDISYAYAPDGNMAVHLQSQNPLLWIKGYFEPAAYEVAENITYDEEVLQEQVFALDCLQEDAMAAPQDAYITFQNGHFEIVSEVEGTTVDKEALVQAVASAVSQSQPLISAEEAGVYAQPAVRSDDKTLNMHMNELNAITTVSIVYQLPTGEEVLNGNVVREWLSMDAEGHYYKDEALLKEKVTEYVEAMAEKVDTVGKEHAFTTSSGEQITVSGGPYGWKINQSEEIAALLKNIADSDQIAREPIYSSRELTTENNGFGNTYIELNLTEQHLYYYQNGKLVIESDFVSGRMTSDRYTPPGIFTLTYKQKDRVLRGERREDGSYTYESHVNYWMPFNRGIGLHDASWRSSFGGTIYKNSGSHGCINLPYAKAKAIYEIITKEVPIICFYTEEYSLR